MLELVISLYVLSALLPLTGLALLLLRAREERAELAKEPTSPEGITYAQFGVIAKHLLAAATSRPRAVLRDFIFIGAGVIAGATGSVLSLML